MALGSAFTAVAEFLGSATGTGWAFVLSAVYAWYTASALMFEGVWGRPVLPVGMTQHAKEAPTSLWVPASPAFRGPVEAGWNIREKSVIAEGAQYPRLCAF
jgi:hypothetical protein